MMSDELSWGDLELGIIVIDPFPPGCDRVVFHNQRHFRVMSLDSVRCDGDPAVRLAADTIELKFKEARERERRQTGSQA